MKTKTNNIGGNGKRFEMITEVGNNFYMWNGVLYKSDIIRSCIRPQARAIGKMVATHVRKSEGKGVKVFPDPYMKFLLQEPNPYMTGQVFQEKMSNILALNNNAFALIGRDENGLPNGLWPIIASNVEAKYDKKNVLSLKFTLKNGTFITPLYSDVIHLRQDFYENDIFGSSPIEVLKPVMEVITVTDQGIVKAIKNSAVIRWIMKFKQKLKPEDRDKQVKEFVKNYLSVGSDNGGAAVTDPAYDIQQIKPESFVPNAAQMDRAITRIYNFFNTNTKIIQSNFSEDGWNAYYESIIEPIAMQYGGEATRKLFNRTQRSFGNEIVLTSNNLTYASMSTKLGLIAFIDRGMMTPNEVRTILNMGPIEGGNDVIRRLDTAVVENLLKKGEFRNIIEEIVKGVRDEG